MDSVAVLANIAKSLIPVQSMITGFAYMLGIGFVLKALMSLKTNSESKSSMASSNSALKEPVVYLIVGSLLIFFPSTIRMLLNTTFGYSSILQYSQEGASTQLSLAVITVIQTIGLFAFIRGWVLVVRASSTGQPPGGVGKGLTHVFGGILAINIVGTIEMVNNTLMGT